MDVDLEVLSEKQSAIRMNELAQSASLSVFEYFHSDKAGHSQDQQQARAVLKNLSSFFDALIPELNIQTTTLVVTSDHGNLEDLSVKTHTRNPVPLIAIGPSAPYFSRVEDLTGITPAIVQSLSSTT